MKLEAIAQLSNGRYKFNSSSLSIEKLHNSIYHNHTVYSGKKVANFLSSSVAKFVLKTDREFKFLSVASSKIKWEKGVVYAIVSY